MKRFNNFLIGTVIILSHGVFHAKNLLTQSVDHVKEMTSKDQLDDFSRTMHRGLHFDTQDDALFQIAEEEKIVPSIIEENIVVDGQAPQTSHFVKYDDQQRLKAIESLALQQPSSDSVESVAFNFEDIDLHNVAEYMERVHKVKFVTDDILDSGKPGQKLAGNKVSFRTNMPLSKQESWSLFITFLSMAGLDIVPMSQAGFYRIVPLPTAAQEAIPAYIGSSPSLLPDTNMVVRYVYFMQNADPAKIQPLISKFQGATGSLLVYKDLRALIFTDKSYNIKSLMTIVKELDKPALPQAMSVVKLKRANVEDVMSLYNSLKPSASGQNARAWAPDNKDMASEFFSQNVVLSGDKRTNTLIILGPKDGVARLEDFIAKYIDIDPDKSKVPVFVYYLEYTNAVDMQKTISALVPYGSSTPAGQYGGVRDGQKYLQPMTIVADNYSNSLIINATQADYPAVEKLIKQLDVPQKQVALEVLIVQVTGIKSKVLGSQISGPNPDNTFLSSVSGQTSGIPIASGVVTTPATSDTQVAQSIKSNLSSLLISPLVNQAGSTLLTFGAPIWAVFKILKTITNTKILQNPFIVVSNNCKGLIKVGVSRRVVTGEAISNGNTAATGYQTAEANLSVEITPQVNDEKMVNMAITISDNKFINSGSNDAVQDQKTITTMASVADGEVLVLGGIMQDNTTSQTSGVPLLSKIPVFGWLFKNKSNSETKSIFVVFICPKVLDNINTQKEVQKYTRDKIEEAQDYLRLMDEAETLDAHQDPIDRLFFGESERKADDLTTARLLDRGEVVSRHEKIKRDPVGKDKPKSSKYHKNRQVALESQDPFENSFDKKNMSDKKVAQRTLVANNKYGKVGSIDMSENDQTWEKPSIYSIKNMVQMSSGGATL